MFQKTLVWLFISLNTILFAQKTLQVKGIVLDAKTLQPLEGVNIIGQNNLYAVSNSSGEFSINSVVEGTYSFKISHISCKHKNITLAVVPDMEFIKILLDESENKLDEVEIVGKTKHRVVQESPVVTQIISKDFLETNRENSLMQTLSKIPGISSIKIGSGQSKPVIRGLGFNRVVVVQNGIKHEAQQWGNDHGLEIDQFGIESIKIIKGPASLVYGSDAIAGVVDIQPNKVPLKHSFNGEANLIAQSNNNMLATSVSLEKRNEKWYYRGRLTYKDYGDYKVPTNQINYENYIFELHENNLRNTAGREANAGFGFGYVANNIKSETYISNVNAKNGFFANAHGLEVRTSSIDYDSSSRDIDFPFHKVNHFKVTNNTVLQLNKHTVHLDFGFQNNHREEHSEPTAHGYMPKPNNSKERAFYKNTYAFNLKDTFKAGTKNNIVAGINVEFQDNKIGGWGFLIPEYNRFSIGAFAFNTLEINPNLFLLAGARYDFGLLKSKSYFDWFQSTVNNANGTTSMVYLQRAQNKTLDFGNASASVGLSYLHKNTNYKVNIGKSFRMPLANELTSDGVNYHMYRFEQGNLNLKPEESYQIDVDIKHNFKNSSVGISPFVNFFENFIYLNPTSDYYETLQIYKYTQSKIIRFGGEFTASATVLKKLDLNASVEYVYSRQTSGEKKNFTLPFSPPLSALLSASYTFNPFGFLKSPQLNVDYRLTAAQNEIVPPEEVTAGYQLLNLSFSSKTNLFNVNKPLQIRLKLKNIFNTKYYDHTSFYRLIDVPEAGRNLSISLTQTF